MPTNSDWKFENQVWSPCFSSPEKTFLQESVDLIAIYQLYHVTLYLSQENITRENMTRLATNMTLPCRTIKQIEFQEFNPI